MQPAIKVDTMNAFPLHVTIPQTQPHAKLAQAEQALKDLHAQKLPLLDLAARSDDLAEINTIAARFRGIADTLVLVGIGGSSLGAEAVCAIADTNNQMRFLVMDNPDPVSFAAIKATVNPKRTAWLMVSKSGGTLETIAQLLLIFDWLEQEIGKDGIKEKCYIITEPKDSALTRLATYYAISTSPHDPELGGRWSCVSSVGLIPAATMGLDIAAFRAGTKAVLDHALNSTASDNIPLASANFSVVNAEAGRSIHAIMPYSDSLHFTASWCRQLISESLGKDGVGITPLAALGTVDQHSMLQLLLGGTDDKIYTLITATQSGKGEPFAASLAKVAGMEYLAGKTLGDVLDAFQHGTVESLQAKGRLVRTIHLDAIDAYHLGALLMLIMLETIYAATLMQVNAFDQPAVEDSKIYAKRALGIA
jgi:glucose-6-phosphate isomerase